jgi:hypothetical protein
MTASSSKQWVPQLSSLRPGRLLNLLKNAGYPTFGAPFAPKVETGQSQTRLPLISGLIS